MHKRDKWVVKQRDTGERTVMFICFNSVIMTLQNTICYIRPTKYFRIPIHALELNGLPSQNRADRVTLNYNLDFSLKQFEATMMICNQLKV